MTLMHPAWGHEVAEQMRTAANNWLASVSGDLRARAVMEVSTPERSNWHFVPRSRKGVPLGEMQEKSREHLLELLRSGLSQRGYLQATTIVTLENILRDIEQGRGPVRDPALYYLTIFGQPQPKKTWGWRFEGHHLSLNFLIVDGKEVTVAPSFFGSNPAEVRDGPRQGLRNLKEEEDLARQLVKSLSPKQRTTAVFSENAPADIITGNSRNARRLDPGINYEDLEPEQQANLKQLVETYVHRYRLELAETDLKRIAAAGWNKISFSWAGGMEPGQGHYYRVQGPTFLLEYDNTQNRANHIHTVWRDYERDFGGDLLKEHYAEAPHSHAH